MRRDQMMIRKGFDLADSELRPVPRAGAWPCFSPDDVQAVGNVLISGKVNYWTGNECRDFERDYATELGVKHAVAVVNGSVALELALAALGIGPGDEVIVTPRSFVASASCVVMRGATPVFANVDRYSQNLTAATIEEKITSRTKAVLLVHLAGWPCEMDEILEVTRTKEIAVIEDCAQAHGALYRDRPVGSMGHVNAFSFCQDKIISTGGEGGLLTTNDPTIWNFAWSYKDHGKSYDAVYNRKHSVGYRWLHESFGTNWRMLEMQAVLGRRALARYGEWIEKRRKNAEILTERFQHVPVLRVTVPPRHVRHSYYKYYVYLRLDALKDGWTRERITEEIVSRGVPALSGYGEMYMEKAFQNAGLAPAERLPVSKELAGTALVFLVHPTMSEEFMHYAADTAAKVLERATR